jgi:SAM-dependent methyltransferase
MASDMVAGHRVLDIGCGRNKLPGAVGLDNVAHSGVDIVVNLNDPLPLGEALFDVVNADQVLEHVQNLPGLMREIHRVLAPGGLLVAHVPYFRSSWAHVDPTHVRAFTIRSLDYFIHDTMFFERYRFIDAPFEKVGIFLDSHRDSTVLRALCSSLALAHPDRFENSLLSFLYPFELITFVLRKPWCPARSRDA